MPTAKRAIRSPVSQTWPSNPVSALEIGCGTGAALQAIARSAGPAGCVVGLDLSPGMLEKSQAKAHQHDYTQSINLVEADALVPPFPGAAFDVIFLSFTLELFSEPEMPVLLATCLQMLRSTGRIGVVALKKEARLAGKIYTWFHRRWPDIVDCRPIDTGQLLRQTGFIISSNRCLTMWGLPVDILTARKL